MNLRNRTLLIFSVLLPLLLAACSLIGGEEATTTPTETAQAQATPTLDPLTGEVVNGIATVDKVDVLVLESFPVQITVVASGNLPDGCTTLSDVVTGREGNTFTLTLNTSRLAGAMCTEALVPYDKVVSLDVAGLPAGDYTVLVNGVSGTFNLAIDNVLTEATPTTPPVEPTAGGTITGRVWHDLCAVAGGEGGTPATSSEGCLANADGSFQANGLLEAGEPGLADIVVTLGSGACPSAGLQTTTTDPDGNYGFTGLAAGSYCVSVDTGHPGNLAILIPGDWTAPAAGQGFQDVEVGDTGSVADVNLGWDYQFLPEPENTTAEATTTPEPACTDSASFVADVTVLDYEIIPPGLVFTKTWRLLNNGTCTWTTNYALVFSGGDRLGGATEQPLPLEVAPNTVIDLSVVLTTPQRNGTYWGNWILRNANGDRFGLPLPNETFYYVIEVASAIEEETSISGLLWADACGFLADASAGTACLPDGSGGFTANGLAEFIEARLSGVVVSLGEGACPSATVVATFTTGPDGRYLFTDLQPGIYCVFVDGAAAGNAAVLADGRWNGPESAEAGVTITIEALEVISDINFGWEYLAE